MYIAHCRVLTQHIKWKSEISVPATETYESRFHFKGSWTIPFPNEVKKTAKKSLLALPLCTKLGFNQFLIQLCDAEIQMTTKLTHSVSSLFGNYWFVTAEVSAFLYSCNRQHQQLKCGLLLHFTLSCCLPMLRGHQKDIWPTHHNFIPFKYEF